MVGEPVDLRDRRIHVDARPHRGAEQEAVEGEAEVVERPPVPGLRARFPHLERVHAVVDVVEEVTQT